ncbi:MAG: hypothetical protein CME07_01045, partial [Gemmatimonadetes bacterium]|nr:hypothetical protein [Gemmatimonadota bacterium]
FLLPGAALLLLSFAPPEDGRIFTVREVQETSSPVGDSPRAGETVRLRGVVTAVSPHGRFYYVSDPDGGAWSGLKIEAYSLDRVPGEQVVVDGTVTEWWGETRLLQEAVRSLGVAELPDPAPVTVADLLLDGETWEGVLVRLGGATVTDETSRYGEYTVSDTSGDGAIIDDEFFTSYIADIGDTFDSITGVMAFGWSNFCLEPRSDADLTGWVSVRDFDAVLTVEARDESGDSLPARVVLTPDSALPELDLGPEDRAEGSGNTAYIPPGGGDIRLPSGIYDVMVSRGPEYSVYEERVAVSPGGSTTVLATLKHEVDVPGWVSGDFHLHCAPSSDTPLPVPGRVLSLAAEGVEWAIATDHNVVTDYTPVIEGLGLTQWMTSSIGDEITTRSPSFGHFNAWPLDAGRVSPPYEGVTPEELFAGARTPLRDEIVQVNHPSIPDWGNQYFDIYGVNSHTGEPENPGWSWDFDAIEVMNGGFIEQGMSNFRIWMRWLNSGRRITATGNSDSHHIAYSNPGYPRNFVASSSFGPGDSSEEELVAAVLAGRVFVSYGPVLDFRIDGEGLGETVVPDSSGQVEITCRVRCASWLRVGQGTIYRNAVPVRTFPLAADAPGVQDITYTWHDRPEADSWYLVLVEGEAGLDPVEPSEWFRPLAFTNPIRVDADRDGQFTPPGNEAPDTDIGALDPVDADGVPVRAGQWVSIEGCATTLSGFIPSVPGRFYLDDGTGGIQVREVPGTPTLIERGDIIRATGIVGHAVGETFLLDADIQVVSVGGVCPPPIDLATGSAASPGEALEGRVVRITGADVTSGSWPVGGAEGLVQVNDGTGNAPLYIPAGVVVPPEAMGMTDLTFAALVTQHDFSPPYTSGYRLTLRNGTDLLSGGTSVSELPARTAFGQARPNPFRGIVEIPFVLGKDLTAPADLSVVDVQGRRVRDLGAIPRDQPTGRIQWDGRDRQGQTVAAGVYFLRLRAGGVRLDQKIVKIR